MVNPRRWSTVRRSVKRALPAPIVRRLRPAPVPWIEAEPEPATPDPLPGFGFNAIVGTWMEADVIADTVANAFAQGVERVFLLDNDSPDDTIERAVSAGAEHVMTYRTDAFEEQYRYNLMNEFVRHQSMTGDVDHVWWLWLDADEFPRPASGGTIREMLERIDRRFRVVGARILNHYPTPGEPAYVAGDHPIDHQPLCEEVPHNICALMHRKHPLQRWDRHGPRIDAGLGFHRAECDVRPLLEPTDPLVVHHVPYRDEMVTRRRLEVLWAGKDSSESRAREDDEATGHMAARLKSLDAVYAGDWANVHNFLPDAPPVGVTLVDWRELRPAISFDIRRWGPG